MKIRSILLTILLLNLSCGTWIGNPPDEEAKPNLSNVNVIFQGSSPQPTPPVTPTTNGFGLKQFNLNNFNLTNLAPYTIPVTGKTESKIGEVQLSTALLGVKNIKIKNSKNIKDNTESFKGPFVVDLINNTITPAPTPIQLEVGNYDIVEFELVKIDVSEFKKQGHNISQEINNRSVYLSGNFVELNNNTKPLTIAFNLTEKLTIDLKKSQSTFDIKENITNELIVAFSLDKWFNFSKSNEDFDDYDSDSIDVSDDDDDDKTIQELVKKNIKSSVTFGKDLDDDGDLDDDDRDHDSSESEHEDDDNNHNETDHDNSGNDDDDDDDDDDDENSRNNG